MNVKTFLLRCGWTKGVGANFYLPNTHPHIHLILDGVGLDTIEVGTNDSYRNKQDAYNVLRPQIRVVAISDGQRGANLISGGIETKNIKNALNVLLTPCAHSTCF